MNYSRDPNILDRISNRLSVPEGLNRTEYMDFIDELYPEWFSFIMVNIRKTAKAIYEECKAYKNADGRIKASLRDDGKVDVYHAFGSTVQAYEGDSAQKAFDRVIFSIDLHEIDWDRPLLKYIEIELKQWLLSQHPANKKWFFYYGQ